MANVEVKLDDNAVRLAINSAEKVMPALQSAVDRISANANALSSSFRTGRFYDRSERKLKGDTQPHYAGDVRKMGKGPIGIVYTANYSAMKENHLHNTLLKSAHK